MDPWIDEDTLEKAVPSPPLRGPGWYSAPTVKFCLEKQLINWSCVSQKCVSTGKLPPEYFRTIIERFDAIAEARQDSKLGKDLTNKLIGVFATERN